MEFQALTGSVAFAVTQTAVALFMLGLYIAARRDACTRYWAIASALVAVGVIAPFPFIGTSLRLPSMAVSNTAIVAGLVWMWWGMRVFFGRAPKAIGWWLIGAHAVIFGGIFAFVSETQFRVIIFAVAVAIAVTLIVLEVWRGSGTPLTVARRLVVFAYAVTLAPIIVRALILLGTGTGSFAAKTDYATGTNPVAVAIADVNGDGKPDIVAANKRGVFVHTRK